MTAPRFTEERRALYLGLLETGRNVEEACAAVGVSRSTVSKWAARGRRGHPEAAEFAARFDAIREGRGEEGLTDEDLVALLERSARRGSVRAIEVLLKRTWEEPDQDRPPSVFDGEF